MTPLLHFSSVARTYHLGKKKWMLGPLTFSVERGEGIAVSGPSGSGKSTLLHLAAGLDRPSAGTIFFAGKNLAQISAKEMEEHRNKEIGFIFQDFHLLPEFTLVENVMMPLIIARKRRAWAREKAEKALAEVGLLEKGAHLPRKLSGGERQRGAIARAILHDPKIIFADEPTGNLDEATGRGILTLLKNLQKLHGIALMVVTHDEKIAEEMERHILIADGKIQTDTKKE